MILDILRETGTDIVWVLRGIAGFFGADRYLPQANSLNNDPVMMVLYCAGNLGNLVAYITIGVTLIYKRTHIIHLSPGVFKMFGAFLLLGSLSYVTQLLTMFVAVYRLDVMIMALTAAVSVVVAAFTVSAVFEIDTKTTEKR